MFSPEMMANAQKMMANMKPEDMQRMSQMAANMDPKVMESMMKNMNGGQMPGNVDTAEALKQMKNMTPEQMRQGMTQAQSQMSAQKQYMYNASEMLKNEGNTEVKNENFIFALSKYNKALENLKQFDGDDVATLKVNLLNNAALCYLKLQENGKALECSEDALKIQPSSHKALFRRGSALEAQGKLGDAVLDVRRAAELAPSDAAIGRELTRLRAELKAKGIDEATLVDARPPPSKHEVSSAWQAPGSTAGGSSGSRASAPGAMGTDQWSKAAEQIAENPDMLRQAQEAMSKMSPEDMAKMMDGAALPPGVDASTVKAQMAELQKNPDLLKTAMDNLKSLPPDERKRMMSQRYQNNTPATSSSRASGSSPATDANMSPEMIKEALNMTKNLTPEQLKAMNIGSPEDAEMMAKTAQQLQSNPEMMDMMTNMMSNMTPEQMQDMMNMSSRFRGAGGAGPDGREGGGDMPADPMAMMNDPEMMKAAEQMMASMSPEMLSSMAKASGVELSEDKAKLVARFLPYLLKLVRLLGWLKKLWSRMWSARGRVIIAVIIVLLAMLQHFWWR